MIVGHCRHCRLSLRESDSFREAKADISAQQDAALAKQLDDAWQPTYIGATFVEPAAVTNDQRRIVIYAGRVQGVGFRYTTCRIAQSHAVKGFVRNLRNGNVELAVEGQGLEVDRFLAAIRAEMGAYIDSADVQTAPATGEFQSFGIAY